jgi:hypothetical protein
MNFPQLCLLFFVVVYLLLPAVRLILTDKKRTAKPKKETTEADFAALKEQYNQETEQQKEDKNPLNNCKMFVIKSGGTVRHFRTVAEKIAYLEGRGEIETIQEQEVQNPLPLKSKQKILQLN